MVIVWTATAHGDGEEIMFARHLALQGSPSVRRFADEKTDQWPAQGHMGRQLSVDKGVQDEFRK